MEKKYECKNCGGIITTNTKTDENKLKCCKKPNLVLLSIDKPTQKEADELRVGLGKCYEQIVEVLRYYMDMPENYYPIIAVWIIGTYLHECFDTYPYLYANAMRGSAKTRLLKLIAKLSRDGEVLASLTEAVLFRTNGTLCIDEFERIASRDKGDLRELLNTAYKKGIKIKRMKKSRTKDGEKQVVEEFDAFRPIAMANIWGMEEVLGDRCLGLILEKSSNPAVILKIEDYDRNYTISEIKSFLQRNQCSLCSVVYTKNITQNWNNYISNRYTTTTYTTTYNTHTTNTTLPTLEEEEMYNKIHDSKIDGRNLELLFPLLIVAKQLNEETFELLLKIGTDLIKKKKQEELAESKDIILIDYVSQREPLNEFVKVLELTNSFKDFLGEIDEDDKKGRINTQWVGRALKRLNLYKEKRRISRGIEIVLDVQKAKEQMRMFK